MEKIRRFDSHTHTHKSNIQHRDSTNFESTLIDKALELGLGGIAITDHANLSAHVDALQYLKSLREKASKKVESAGEDMVKYLTAVEEKALVDEFKLGLGTEIYLVDRDVINDAREKNEYTRFYHLIVVAKNYEGYRALAELSSKSWEESFHFRGVERIPTYKDYFFEWAKRNRGNFIVTTACLGSEFSKLVLQFAENQSVGNRALIDNFLRTMIGALGDDFYIEIQPSHSQEQIVYNTLALMIAEVYGVKVVIDTDAHYTSYDMKEIHSIYLKSQDAERETESFYASTYLMSNDELRSYFPYMPDEKFNECIINSLEISDKITEYDLYRDIEVPRTTIAFDHGRGSILAPIVLNIDKYPYIVKYGTSEHIIDRTLLQQIEDGLIKKNIKLTDEVLTRINTELGSLWQISEKLDQRLSSYYLLTKEIVEIMWLVSLVGVSRGSAGAFYICYLLEITQINPIEYELPEWRHISAERPELPDIDLDTEAGQRANILEKVKDKFGHDKVLNICTFKTEGTVSAIQTMCRGMGISTEESSYVSSLAVDGMSVKQCLEEYKTNKEAAILIKEMMNYDGLIENVIAIEGLVCGRSVHASGVYLYNEEYWKQNAMMKAPKGQWITQYDMKCSDYQGGLKLDFLTIEALDRIRKDMELLIEDNIIEYKGSLKATYDSYIHPDVLERDDKGMWNSLCAGDILDAFQFDSVQGKNAIAKIHPHNLQEAMDGNALMRLSCEGEQPIDKYVKHKRDINIWFNEMREKGLNEREIEVMKKHLLKSYGIAATQESVMILAMDKEIACFDLAWANKLRKAIAKAKAKHLFEEVKERFFNNGQAMGNRINILEYVWETCIVPMLGYSFSIPHIAGYTLILLQEMNLAYRYSQLHWKVACLCVNAGDINDTTSKATDYGALAKAIAGMSKGFVTAPYINSANVGFKPDMATNTCTFGLGAINGVSNELAKAILDLRPFNGLEDFITRCVDTKLVQPSKMYNLIKAGCFDKLVPDRISAMAQFVTYLAPDKSKLTSANIPKLLEYNCVPGELRDNITLLNFKKCVFDKKNVSYMVNKTQGYYKIPQIALEYFNRSLSDTFITATEYDENGDIILFSKEFDKIYKKEQAKLDEWLKSEDALMRFNYSAKNELWMKYCLGSVAKWEMDSLSYYTNHHELDEMDLSQFYNITQFNELPRVPERYPITNARSGRVYFKNKLDLIAGTVVDKNKAKSMITINTQSGVVEVKLNKESFSHYDRKTTDESSWFTRGNKLILVGFRREESFVPKVYSDSPFKSCLMKVTQNHTGNVEIIREREFETKELEEILYL